MSHFLFAVTDPSMKEDVNKKAFDKFEQSKGKPKREDANVVPSAKSDTNGGKHFIIVLAMRTYTHKYHCLLAFEDHVENIFDRLLHILMLNTITYRLVGSSIHICVCTYSHNLSLHLVNIPAGNICVGKHPCR